MTAIWALAVVLFAGNTVASSIPYRILGGEPTTIDKHPSLVQVDFLGVFSGAWGQSCGGSILNSRYVLSVAHCFDGAFYSSAYRRIRAGTTYRNNGGTLVSVTREYNHPSYGYHGNDGDISVVLLATPLVYNPVIQQGPIISQGFEVPDYYPVVQAGWGATAQDGSASDVLRDVTVFTVNRDICRERYDSIGPITENMICAGLLDIGGKNACQGDFGGPLLFNGVIVGVVSWNEQCAVARYPGVSTKVSSYTDWILEIVEN